MAPNITGYAHVRLTVTDIDRSRQFYDRVFGLPVAAELPPDADEQTREQLAFLYGGVVYQVADGVLFGLRPVARAGDAFDPDRTGLDHVSFAVENRDDLDKWAAHLDHLGVPHEGVKDIGMGFILELRDPDNVALELTAPA
ncbi:MAG: VOC family protein [Nocardioidaceae bacterium]|jgi:catechol 2,3-dioxygenase-like lactoylglutathione lyase family enzyme|nr:VOC family protein [Nocardioidaceae bacterium]